MSFFSSSHPNPTPVDQSANRSTGNVYQNNTGKSMTVLIECVVISGGGAIAILKVFIGSANPPTLEVAIVSNEDDTAPITSNTQSSTVSFIVPTGWFYELQNHSLNGGTTSFTKWIEYS